MKEFIIVVLLVGAILFFAPFIGTLLSYLLLFGLFFAIGYFLTNSVIQLGRNLVVHKEDRAGKRV
jgi:uncharacterized protein (DUF58 family)